MNRNLHRTKAFLLASSLVAGILSLPAIADDLHYQDFVVGDQAVALGGAYTAIASDPSGLYYNPAGIVDARNTSLSLSANLYGIQDSWTGKMGSVLPKDAISKLVVVPSTAGFVQSLGRLDTNGERPYAVAISMVVPSYRRFSSSKEGEMTDPVLGRYRQGYHRVFEDQTLWVGAGGAMRFQGRFSFGAGLFLLHRMVQDTAYSFLAGNPAGDSYLDFRSAEMDLNFQNDGLLAIGGMKLKLSDRWLFGASVQSPTVTLYSRGNMRFVRAFASGTGSTGFTPTPQEVSVRSETRFNGEARAGIAYRIQDRFVASADVSVHLPVSYTLVQVDNQEARDALLFAPEIKRSLILNFNAGAEVLLAGMFSIGLGGFTNFSSAPSIEDGNAQHEPALADVDMFGGTLAVGFFSEHSLTRVGVMYTYGSGHDLIAINPAEQLATDQQSYSKVDLHQSFTYFFLSSTFRY
jgi:hypothetical protein